MNNNETRQVLATITSASGADPQGSKRLRLGFQTDDGQEIGISLVPRFSNRSRWGKAFLAATHIKPSHFRGSDPLGLMVGKSCTLVLAQTDGGKWRVSQVLPGPSPQLDLGLELGR
ncbi:MAG: hypothetical protein QF569_28435 [Candidatus Poribacteria bacterium]|jgi:hypothetical protein|nr:hypothetical protein [Candidatus Poribacteria bacterium]